MSKKSKSTNSDANLEKLFKEDRPESKIQNPPLLPQHPFRLIDAGASGSGKTYILFKALIEGELLFDKLYIYARDIQEHKYTVLIKHYVEIAKDLGIHPEEIITIGDHGKDIVAVDQLDPTKVNLVIFDDWITDKKTMEGVITDHWIRGRKKNASYCFLAQSYYNIPKMIRLNSDYFILFKFPEAKSNQLIISEQKGDLEYDQFKRLFNEATKDKHSWVFIDKKTADARLKVRKGFKQPLKILQFEDKKESDDDDNSE